jgi:hypothetical protein
MKYWNSAFNAQGSRGIKIAVDGFLSFTLPLSWSNVNVLVCRFFWKFILCTTQLRVLVLCVPYFTDNSIVRILWQCKMACKYSASQGTSRYNIKGNCPFFLVSFCCCYCHLLSLVVASMGAFQREAWTRVNQHLL